MKSKGFTLIELLVVIAVIGVLATIVLGALNTARSKARDAKRDQDIKTIQTALEMYHLDHGAYPTVSSTWMSSNQASWVSLSNKLGMDLPVDPLNETGGHAQDGYYTYTYISRPDNRWCYSQLYVLVYNKENSNGVDPDNGIRNCYINNFTFGDAFVVGVSPNNQT